jgi:ribosome biogenesis GTPase
MVVFHLHEWGWNSFFSQHLRSDDSRKPARVIEQQRSAYHVVCEAGELLSEVSGRLRRAAQMHAGAMPVVGDWVFVDIPAAGGRAIIHEVLPRKSKFSRKAAGLETAEQVIAANIDTAFLVTSLNGDLNPRRIERYLTTIWDSGAQPVILLSKADLCDDVSAFLTTLAGIAAGAPTHVLSSITGAGLEQLDSYLTPGKTAALLGSSGVGKSTLINRLLGRAIQKVREIREDDDRGRHVTTSRRLFRTPSGGLLIDTPGMRELQLWDTGDGISRTFTDIQEFAHHCRFRDCSHESEPGCAVQSAIAAEELSAQRLEAYLKLRREIGYLERQQDVFLQIEENRKWKRIHKAMRERYRQRDRGD